MNQNYTICGAKKDGTCLYVSRARTGGMFTPHKTWRRKMTKEHAFTLVDHLNQRHTGQYLSDGTLVAPQFEHGWEYFCAIPR